LLSGFTQHGKRIYQCSARAIDSLDTRANIRSLGDNLFHAMNALPEVAGSAIKENTDRVQEDRQSCDQQRDNDHC
jgi:hypothetical protein